MSKAAKTLFLSVVAVLSAILLMNVLAPSALSFTGSKPKNFTVAQFQSEVESNHVESAAWQSNEITGKLTTGERYSATVPDITTTGAQSVIELLNRKKVEWEISKPPVSQGLLAFLSVFAVPILLFLAIYLFFIRPAQAGGNQALSFGRSKAKRVGETGPKITFDDVAGIEEAKQELFEIVDFLKNTKKYVALGAKIPRGILLTGPPGVGKTHLARAIAGEAGVPFFHISGSDFVEMFVGVGAARVRDLFETAKAHRPCLIFVDEIDAVGRQRGAGLGGGHDEREQTLNQLLVEMDGFDPNAGVILIAATNRPDVLDPALLRPGRFDRQIVVDPPDAKGREAILKIHAKGKPLDGEVKLDIVAKRTPGFTGADLANALNESALLAARRNQTKITMHDIEEAIDRVMVGPARGSRVFDPKEREVTAFHEAGHAIVGELLEGCHPIHKVTILPRGLALGVTWSIPDSDKMLRDETELLDDISMALGGRVSEEVVFGKVWTGSGSDLEYVTRVARAMVCQFGMSKKLGTLALGRRSNNPFLGRDYHDERNYSEEIAKQIDEEVHSIVERCHQRAVDLLTSNRDKLDKLVEVLLERETIGREEFLAVLNGQELPPFDLSSKDEGTPAPPEPATDKETGKKPGRVPPPRFEPGPA